MKPLDGANETESLSALRDIATSWYRDSRGFDTDSVGEISLGGILSYFVWQTAATVTASYRYCEERRRGPTIHVAQEVHPLTVRIASSLGKVVFDQEDTLVPLLDLQRASERMVRVPKSATAVRLVQPLFRGLSRRYTNLYITDWTLHHLARSDPKALILYHKSIHRSVVPHVNSRNLVNAEKLFPNSLQLLQFAEKFHACVARTGINLPESVTASIISEIESGYKDIRETLVRSFAQFENILDFYEPRVAHLPSDSLETWILMHQLCRSRGIPTRMYVDGYQVVPVFPLVKTASGKDWLCDRVASFGQAQCEMIASHDFPRGRIDVMDFPIMSHYSKTRTSPARASFDAVVLTWTPFYLNPLAVRESPASTLRRAILTLIRTGLSKIAVKIRWEGERPYVEKVMSELGIHLPILEGPLYRHMRSSADLYVGGISTALAEVVACQKRYIVFEPAENGYPDQFIRRSLVISPERVARDEETLERMIREAATSWIGDPDENLRVHRLIGK